MQYFSTDEDILTPVLVAGALKKKKTATKKIFVLLNITYFSASIFIILFYSILNRLIV